MLWNCPLRWVRTGVAKTPRFPAARTVSQAIAALGSDSRLRLNSLSGYGIPGNVMKSPGGSSTFHETGFIPRVVWPLIRKPALSKTLPS